MSIKIVGICFVKNEDIYIEQVLKNIVDFCDEIRVIDNYSTDKTVSVVKEYTKKYSKIKLEKIKNISKSHCLVEKYAGENKWVFGVDGDEIYDPKGLSIIRQKILNEEYQNCWMLRGYFYHLIKLDIDSKKAVGYMAPPSKDPNKLYNFSLLKSWKSDGFQPLFHCQTHKFKNPKYYSQHYPKKKKIYKLYNWNNCPLRCVHMRMLQRSSIEKIDKFINTRLNLSNVISNKKHNFRKKYRIDKKIKKDISVFFN